MTQDRHAHTAITMPSHTTRQKTMTSQRPKSFDLTLPGGLGAFMRPDCVCLGVLTFRGRSKSSMSLPDKIKIPSLAYGSGQSRSPRPFYDYGLIKLMAV